MIYISLFLLEVIALYFLSRSLSKNLTRIFSIYILSLIFLPGTFIHEISHFLTALFLLVPVGTIELIPTVNEEESQNVRLGSVPVAKVDFVRRTLVGVSPIIFGIGIIFGAFYYSLTNNLLSNVWIILGVSYLCFEVGNTMFLSKKDLEGSWVFLLFLGCLFLAFYIIGVRVNVEPDSFLSSTFIEIVKKMNIFFLVPIFTDILVLTVMTKFNNKK